jgi:hypothetical protein
MVEFVFTKYDAAGGGICLTPIPKIKKAIRFRIAF